MAEKSRTTSEVGHAAEEMAEEFLRQQGLKTLERNFRCKMGEIDLIMSEANTLVFVEVRLRQNPNYLSGAESITHAKMRRLARTAEYYLLDRAPDDDFECRFDVISMDESIDWIRDAFDLDSFRA